MSSKLNPGMYSSETPEWYTPKHILSAVELAFTGTITLDPCSNSKENPNVPAKYHFTEDDNGLEREWFGRVFMNPPYGRLIRPWVKKYLCEYENGNMEEAIALVPARTDTAWFSPLFEYQICFIRGRLKFSGATNSAPFPSAVVYSGKNIDSFKTAFEGMGNILSKY